MRAVIFPVEGAPFKRDVSSLKDIEDLLGGDFMAGVYDCYFNILVKVGAKRENKHFKYLRGDVLLISHEWDRLPKISLDTIV